MKKTTAIQTTTTLTTNTTNTTKGDDNQTKTLPFDGSVFY